MDTRVNWRRRRTHSNPARNKTFDEFMKRGAPHADDLNAAPMEATLTSPKTNSNSTDEQQEKQNSDIADLPYLKSVFGTALVALNDDVNTLSGLMRPSEALPAGSIALKESETSSNLFGIVCGPISGLLALSFSSEVLLKECLENNPTFASAIILRTEVEFILWLRPLNGLPPDASLEGARLISSGVIPAFCAELAVEVLIYQRGVPLEVDLASLTFTGQLEKYFQEWLLQMQFGQPVVRVNARRKVLNPIYWAVKLSQATGLCFDDMRHVFVVPGEPRMEIIPENRLPTTIATFLHQANQSSEKIPVYEIRPDLIRAIISALRTFCSISIPGESEVLAQFLDKCVEHRAGAVLYKNDAVLACQAFRKTCGLPPASNNRLRHDLTTVIGEYLEVRESHDLQRDGRSQRGFRGLALRPTATISVQSELKTPETHWMAKASMVSQTSNSAVCRSSVV